MGKPREKEEEKVVAKLYKSETPSGEVMGKLCDGTTQRSASWKEYQGISQENRERRSLCRYTDRG